MDKARYRLDIPILVISLAASAERRRKISRRLDELGLAFEFLDAVDGRALSEEKSSRFQDPNRRYHAPHPLRAGAVGCMLSHAKAWRKLLDSDDKMMLILEDDAILPPVICDILPQITALDGRFDMVSFVLLKSQRKAFAHVKGLTPDRNLVVCRYHNLGTTAYLLTRRCAEQLLDKQFPAIHEVDIFMNRWWEHGLATLTVIPPVVAHDYSAPSTIGYDYLVPRFADSGLRERLWRRINRLRDSFAKRRKFAAHLAAVRRRLAATK